MRCDVLAIGTELLLGQIVDTNSSWIGERVCPRCKGSAAWRSGSTRTYAA